MTVADLKWKWKPTGTPWIDPLKEILADVAAMEAGIESPQGVADRTGERDPFEVAEEQAEILAYRASLGLPPTSWAQPTPTGGTGTTAQVVSGKDDGTDDAAQGTAKAPAARAAMSYLKTLPAEPENAK
jgi:capsid protein